MRLQKLTLKNFKGIRDFTFSPMGEDATIYGDNGTGKTTVMDGFVWLITDKDSLNAANFGIKTLAAGVPVSNIDHEVEGVFDVDGREITLKKVFREVWTKKRGSAQASFTGHETLYFVNDVPVKLKVFTEKITEIARPELFRLLTSPRYVNEEMRWEQRRRLLIEVCGDVSDGDVIATNTDFQKIAVMLGGKKSADEYRQEIAYRKTGINKELTAIPVRIDELEKTLPANDHIRDAAKLIDDKAALDSRLSVLRNELSMIESGGAVGIKKKELLEVQNQIQAIEVAHKKALEGVMDLRRDAARKTESALFESKKKEIVISSDIKAVDIEINALTAAVEALRKKWFEEHAKTFMPPENSETCPTCGQSLPESKIEETIKAAQAEFKRIKADLLENINVSGLQHSEKLITAKTKESELIKALKDQNYLVKLAEEAHAKAKRKITEPSGIETSGEHTALIEKAQALDSELGELAIGGHDAAAEVYAQIEAATVSIDTINQKLAEIETAGKTRTRINELMADEKRLAGEYEKLEADLHLLEEFTRAKCDMLTDRINAKFTITRWKLFEEQINSGIKDTCIAMHDGVPYQDLNNAMRIRVGADIVRTLQAHYGVHMPIWFDNKESIVGNIDMDCQVISLIVSEEDKELRVETSGNKAQKAA